MVTIACVNYGNYLGRGAEYVDRMQSMVARHMRQAYEFIVLKDEGPQTGWWSKIELFRPGRFTGRVVYLDLDTVIVGDLTPLVESRGTINLLDWGWKTPTICSSVMVWDAGDHEEIYTKFQDWVPGRFFGDQDWITELGGWTTLPAHLCRSYRYHSVGYPPTNAVVINFHGHPKPHECTTGWVPGAWK